jgi:FkbM family methyltransferase
MALYKLHSFLSSISRQLKFLPRGKIGVALNNILIPNIKANNQIVNFQTDNSLKYICDLRSYTENYVPWTGEYEGATIRSILKFVDTSKNILDIGANVGYWTLNLAQKLDSKSKVYSFEPVKANYDRIIEHLKLNSFQDKSKVFNLGLGDKDIMVDFDKSEYDTIHKPATYNAAISLNKTGNIPITTLDKIVTAENISNVGFIKIDVEGFELKVFKGATDFLANNRPVIYGEFTPNSIQEYGNDPTDIFEIFSDYEFFQEVSAGKFVKLEGKKYHRDLLLIPKEKMIKFKDLI